MRFGFGLGLKNRMKDAKRIFLSDIYNIKKNERRINKKEIYKTFNFVRLSREYCSLNHFPDFMILGPQRTGTTWLYSNLLKHPQIFLSNTKEIHYFNALSTPNHPKHKSDCLYWYLSFFYDSPISYIKKQYEMYCRYRENYAPIVRGEATASYAAMDKQRIAEVVKLNSDIKAILIIRNPIERAWSDARKYFFSNMKLTKIQDNQFETFVNQTYQVLCGHYLRMIDNWSSYLRQGNLLIGLFDNIVSDPKEFLLNIFDFLGVKKDEKYISAEVKKRINPSNPHEIPAKYKNLLFKIFRSEFEELNNKYDLSWEGDPVKKIFIRVL